MVMVVMIMAVLMATCSRVLFPLKVPTRRVAFSLQDVVVVAAAVVVVVVVVDGGGGLLRESVSERQGS